MSTKKQIDKKNIVQKIKQAALIYKEKLVGKTFLYVFDDRYIEVIYKAENFRHLTGVDTIIPAKRFYKLAIQNKLESGQIYFSSRHPFALCQKKLKHIMDIASFAASESFMLEEISTDSYTYKFGTTDLSFTLCMGEDLDSNGNKKSSCYVAQSLRDEDSFGKSKNVYTVTHIFSKPNDAKKYSNLLFLDTSSDQHGIPEIVQKLLADNY